jgi:Pyruvate/2-oxoacid:ferredoxin oxidoreductase delta subunit
VELYTHSPHTSSEPNAGAYHAYSLLILIYIIVVVIVVFSFCVGCSVCVYFCVLCFV